VGRENRGDSNDIACCYARVPQGEFEARQALAVFSDSLGEKNSLCDERHEPCRCAVPLFLELKKLAFEN
jgi:hypothetical protein